MKVTAILGVKGTQLLEAYCATSHQGSEVFRQHNGPYYKLKVGLNTHKKRKYSSHH